MGGHDGVARNRVLQFLNALDAAGYDGIRINSPLRLSPAAHWRWGTLSGRKRACGSGRARSVSRKRPHRRGFTIAQESKTNGKADQREGRQPSQTPHHNESSRSSSLAVSDSHFCASSAVKILRPFPLISEQSRRHFPSLVSQEIHRTGGPAKRPKAQ